MSLYIIDGRNDGYPCVPEISELPETGLVPPIPSGTLFVSPYKNNGYPSVNKLGSLPEKINLIYPYTRISMRILGNGFNSGYPCIPALEKAVIKMDSKLKFGTLPVIGMYLGNEMIKNAFCGETPVYKVYWDRNP